MLTHPARWRAVCAGLLTASLFGLTAPVALAQPAPTTPPPADPTPPPPPPPTTSAPTGDGGPSVNDSLVGYIDGAIPGNQFKVRYDAGYNFRRPNKAEFFYPRGAPFGPGLPLPERSVDYQDLTAYGEAALGCKLSVFAEAPLRFLNPEVNDNSNGFGDFNLGFKYALVKDPCHVLTFQFRTYVPTGTGSRGLGTEHVSLEPALLYYERLTDRLRFEGELRYWVPVGGTDFAGDHIRYGVGLQYEAYSSCNVRVSPVAEFVGWTILEGKESYLTQDGTFTVDGVSGDTILNAKFGVRVGVGSLGDFYVGYGRPLTGDRWYESVYRFEWRMTF